ncbi:MULTISPECIES: FAD-binding monooxygenase [Bacteria]
MQSYLNGFHTGDPEIPPTDPASANPRELPETVDVLIVGTGPAGCVLGAQLSAFPGISTRIIERRGGALELGQADGIACRSMEMFEAFGIADQILREACWVNETVFWRPDTGDRSRIVRSGRVQDVEDGLSEFPHVILNQARVQHFLLDRMERSPRRLVPDYGVEFVGLMVDDSAEHPVAVRLRDADGTERVIRARYVVGCDGARSGVREAIGRTLRGDSANQAWGVMDILADTDYPDIRFKSVIQSADAGNMIIIPREGGYLARLYIEMDELDPGERVRGRSITSDDLVAAAQRIFHPHTLDVREIAWWSVYEIGQRLTDKFDDVPDGAVDTRDPRVFIAGDACHTHSPKAGQGMNVSMQDAFNLGWKLAAVLEGRARAELLHTYSAERQAVAARLIAFDREWAAMMSAKATDDDSQTGVDPATLQRHFQQAGRFTAGMATHYEPALLTAEPTWQSLATGFPIGERFHSAPVTRLADARPLQLGHVARADGAWRLYAFGDALPIDHPDSALRALCDALIAPGGAVTRFTPPGADPDSVLDVRGILQQDHSTVDVGALPELLRPRKGRYGLLDYEKAFTPARTDDDIFDDRGIDRETGCLVLVRPDQYVAHVLPLDADALGEFLARFMVAADSALVTPSPVRG